MHSLVVEKNITQHYIMQPTQRTMFPSCNLYYIKPLMLVLEHVLAHGKFYKYPKFNEYSANHSRALIGYWQTLVERNCWESMLMTTSVVSASPDQFSSRCRVSIKPSHWYSDSYWITVLACPPVTMTSIKVNVQSTDKYPKLAVQNWPGGILFILTPHNGVDAVD